MSEAKRVVVAVLVVVMSGGCAKTASDGAGAPPSSGAGGPGAVAPQTSDGGAALPPTAVDIGAPVSVVNVQPDQDFNAADDAALNALFGMYSTVSGTWTTGPRWSWANDVEAVEAGLVRSNGVLHTEMMVETYDKNSAHDFLDDVGYDDEAWWANAWVRAYDLTGQVQYLDMAKIIFSDMLNAWDPSTCNGGLWWNRNRNYKNAITNELFLLLAASLHNRTVGDTDYLAWADREWAWFQASGLINSANLVNDGLTADCQNNGGTTWTYNQGVVLGALAELYKARGTPAYLTTAESIADAALANLVTVGGILQEPCELTSGSCNDDQKGFKGIFERHLARLYEADGLPRYGAFLRKNALSLWAKDRRADGALGLLWSGPFDGADAPRQASGMVALSAVAEPWTDASAFIRAAGGPSFNHSMGQPAGTLAWACTPSSCPTAGFMQWGPYVTSLPLGAHTAHFQLQVDTLSGASAALVTLDVRDHATGLAVARRTVSWSEFQVANAPQDFALPYVLTATHPLEFRVHWEGVSPAPRLTVLDVALDGERSFTAANLSHGCGRLDPLSLWAVDRFHEPGACLASSGPGLVLDAGAYTASFELKVDNFNQDDAPVATLAVVDAADGSTVASLNVTRGQFRNTLFQLFPLDFTAVAGHRYDFQTRWLGGALAPRLTQRALYVQRSHRDVAVSLPYNLRGIGGGPGDGSIDNVGSCFEAQDLSPTVTVGGHAFVLGPNTSGANNVLSLTGGTLSLPAGRYSELALLALAVNGNQQGVTFTVHYADGSTASFTRTFSDWVTPTLAPDERYAVAAPARWSQTGPEYGDFHLFRYSLPLDPTKAVSSVDLPNNSNVKLFAATLSAPLG